MVRRQERSEHHRRSEISAGCFNVPSRPKVSEFVSAPCGYRKATQSARHPAHKRRTHQQHCSWPNRTLARRTADSALRLVFSLFTPFLYEGNEGIETWRLLSPAGVVQERTREGRTPVIEKGDEMSGGDGLVRVTLQRHEKPEAVHRRLHLQFWMCSGERTGGHELDRMRPLAEFPRQLHAAAKARHDARLARQVVRVLEWLAASEKRWRRHQYVALGRPERNRHHVLRERLFIADSGIEALADDIDQRGIRNDLQVDLRVALEKRRNHRR